MSRVRLVLFFVLAALPVAVLLVAGAWSMWTTGIWFWTWWVLPLAWGGAWLLARTAPAGSGPRLPGMKAPEHWTPRDEAAMTIVEERARAAGDIDPERLMDPAYALEQARDLAEAIARHYHPDARDPLAKVTVAEVIAAANLAFEDLERRIDEFVPGSHVVTIGQWRAVARSPKWIKRASGAAWALSTLVNPANLARWASARGAMNPFARQMKSNVVAGFHAFLIRELGVHLIEMNSGRLKGGSRRYREAMAAAGRELPGRRAARASGAASAARGRAADATEPVRAPGERPGTAAAEQARDAASDGGEHEQAVAPSEDVREVVIALVGQSGAGKSSLVTVLTGRPPEEARAGEVTPEVRRHRMVAGRRATGASAADPAQVAHLAAEGAPSVELLDTPGYGDEGATEAERTAIRAACTEADLVLLVMDVRNSARRADAALLDAMASWFAARPHRSPPPILGVLTHVDQLSPFREWDPPYDWSAPTSPKERSIAEAVAYLDDVLGHRLAAVVPICTDVVSGRVHGVREWLEPVMASLLDRAHAGAMVRGLQADLDRERVGRVAGQMRNAGRALVSAAVRGAAMGGRRASDDPGRSAPDGPR